jgi:hypothetical protein
LPPLSLALSADGLDAELIERERKIAAEKAAESGKPEAVQTKMVEGAVAKYAKENALLSQLFVMDNKTPVEAVVAAAAKAAGGSIKLVDYVRFQLGEGIEGRNRLCRRSGCRCRYQVRFILRGSNRRLAGNGGPFVDGGASGGQGVTPFAIPSMSAWCRF